MLELGLHMSSNLDGLRQIPILEVAERLGIRIKGKKALCFSGHDTKPSLSFLPEKNIWKCFGCGLRGSSIDLVMHVKEVNFKGAIDWLSTSFGIRIGAYQPVNVASSKRLRSPISQVSKPQDRKYVPRPDIYAWFLGKCSLRARGAKYLKGRGFTETTIARFQVGELVDPRRAAEECLKRWDPTFRRADTRYRATAATV